MKTRAAVSTGPTAPFRIEELDLDDPRRDEVLVRVEAVGVCHTDVTVKRVWPEGMPIVLGHEGAGIVERVGADVTDVRVGDKVLMSFASCGTCDRCVGGHPAYCRVFQAANVSGNRLDGTPTLTNAQGPVSGSFFGQSTFSRYALSVRRNVVVVDPRLDLTHAAAFGCGIQTGAGAVINVLQPTVDSHLIVYGLGGVGMAAVMAAANLGVGQIIGVDLTESRRATALELGATEVLDGAEASILDTLRELTGGGATHAFDSTGVPRVIRTAAQSLASFGTLVVVGTGADATIDLQDFIVGGKTLRGSIEGDSDPQTMIPRLVDWYLAGALPMERIVTTFPFEDINAAVGGAEQGGVIKPVLILKD